MEKIVYDLQTGEQSIVPLTNEEIVEANAKYQTWLTEQEQLKAKQQEIESAKQSALNKLMALGLTEEEALALGK
jgi:DNA-binding transcriptional regulator YhcF (GntR family)